MTTIEFPEGFLWGTATAAHQVEGGNWNNDWWAWEHNPASGCVEPSGDAIDHYHRYGEDIALLAELGFGTYRFSIEWSRIEPEQGEYSVAALDHYRRMLSSCHEHGIVPIVTFHHFTSPRWISHLGGWEEPDTADHFARFCGRATEHLGDLIGWGCTLNEPNIVALLGYLAGAFPPGRRDPALRRAVNDNFIDAHAKATEAIKSGPGDFPVGMCVAMSDYQAVDGGEAKLQQIRRNMNDVYLEAARGDDFVGVQCYSRDRVGPDGIVPPPEGAELTLMGYEFYPESLEATIRYASDVTEGTPILVTENGIGTDDDARRIEYYRRALQGVRRCLDDGIEVRGYTAWSAFDNFEWALGYKPTFGIIAVDGSTQVRTPKPSAHLLGEVAKSNRLDLA
ncbi:MAG: glycoside hydrolase family 1 protein [Actinomycetota bacterium]|nr:glycoside hydrolase family 1 protein [Actinomycetota bacterium]